MFPRDRFERAGASPEELDQLEGEYNASSPAEQESHNQQFDGQAESGLREHLDGLRKTRHFGNDIPGVEVGDAGEPIPSAPSQQEGTEGGTDGSGHPVGGSANDPSEDDESAEAKAEGEAKEKADAEAAAKQKGSGSGR